MKLYYATLRQGQTINVNFNDHDHKLEVKDCKPEDHVSILDVDCYLDIQSDLKDYSWIYNN